MGTPIQYPNTGGNRHSSASAKLKISNALTLVQYPASGPFAGWTEIAYTWDLKPVEMRGHHPDPMGHTLGQASYTLTWACGFAEFYNLLNMIGPGFAAVPLVFTVAYSENGFDTIVDEILGVRITKGAQALKNTADPLIGNFECSPLKIKPNGMELLPVPMSALTA